MRILHYTLGLPPIRTGGLTRYAMDLMKEQCNKEHEVLHLYPGNIDLFKRNTRIVLDSSEVGLIKHYKIINSLPLPLFRGIKEPYDFMKAGSKELFRDFLENVKPNVIHIHTLMGLHKEFIIVAKELKIKLVFTTHDYFGICPTINLFRDNENMNCNDFNNGNSCVTCCYNAMGTKSLLLAQTSLYPTLKKLKKLKPNKKNNLNINTPETINYQKKQGKNSYYSLREFYLSMLKEIDYFHFNSSVTEEVFKSYLPEINGEIIGITHSGIKKTKIEKSYSSKIRLGYLGPLKEYKGFYQLINSFKQLDKEKYELHLYGDDSNISLEDNVFIHGRYSIGQLSTIFSSFDVLIVPSIWKETFGFTTLESLSFCTPVIVSNNVGSKDLVNGNFGWIFNSESELLDILKKINKTELQEKYVNIKNNFEPISIEEHAKQITYCAY